MKKVVFIMGAGHCGSTLLDLILGSHSSGFSLAEFHVITRLIDGPEKNKSNICVLCEGECEFWNKKVSLSTLGLFYSKKTIFNKLRGKVLKHLINPYQFLFKWSGKEVLIDSSKVPYWFRTQLTPAYAWKNITPYLIYLKRDGRAVVNSYLRKYPEKGFERITQEWIKNITELNQYYSNFPFDNKIAISYEELAKYPERTIEMLCDFIGISFEKEMLLYWAHDHHPIAGNGGTQSLILKHRESMDGFSSDYRLNMNEGNKYYQKHFYDQVGLAIKFDERWKRELTDVQIEKINEIVGDINNEFIGQ